MNKSNILSCCFSEEAYQWLGRLWQSQQDVKVCHHVAHDLTCLAFGDSCNIGKYKDKREREKWAFKASKAFFIIYLN